MQVDRGRRDAGTLGDRPYRHRLFVAGVGEQDSRGGKDLLAKGLAVASLGTMSFPATGAPGPRPESVAAKRSLVQHRPPRLGCRWSLLASRRVGPGQVVARHRCACVAMAPASARPWRACQRRIGAGAHQFQSPARRMNAGTSTPRTSVASTITASAMPSPRSLRKVTPLVTNVSQTTAMSAAAAVMSLPVRSSPTATARRLSPVSR